MDTAQRRQKELDLPEIGPFSDIFVRAKDYEATDILILENRVPRLGRLKNYHPVADFPEARYIDIENFIDITTHPDGNRPKTLSKEYSFSIKGHGRYRVSATTSEQGLGLSIRRLPYYIPLLKDIDKRNFLRGLSNVFEGKENLGLILHTGSTGAGKSTSIASEVDAIARNITGKILTYEDPIEYQYTPTKAVIQQFQIGRDVDSYIDGMKSALRNDPSVIVIGEVRLHEEIRSMVDIAMRGHLVFATLHTSNALNTLRFLDSVAENKESWRQLIAFSIKAIISQKLIYRKDYGFILIPEVFIPNDVVRNKIARGEFKDIKDIFYGNNLRENGSFTFEDSLNILYRDGIILEAEKRTITANQNILT